MSHSMNIVAVGAAYLLVGCAVESAETAPRTRAQDLSGPHAAGPAGRAGDRAIGLALEVNDGVGRALSVRAGQAFYIDQIDLRAALQTSVDEGVAGLDAAGDFASLDWSGLSPVDEDFPPEPDAEGRYTRRRFYRGARWMEEASDFRIEQLDAQDRVVAAPWRLGIGTGDGSGAAGKGSGGFFVRRSRAIQHVHDCPAARDCTGAVSFEEEALVELRHATRRRPIRHLEPETVRLRLTWRVPGQPRTYEIPVVQVAAPPYDYGLDIGIEPLTVPEAGGVYPPGAQLDFRVSFRDASGRLLHDPEALPSYEASLAPGAAGLQYFNNTEPGITYWRRKHREHQLLASIAGPAQAVQAIRTPIGIEDALGPGAVTTGELARDGVFGQLWSFPAYAALGDVTAPVSTRFTFELPEDAPPGTYLVTVKARRSYLGQELPVSETIEVQVGSPERTSARLGVGGCESCHEGGGALERVLHGNAALETCATCHAPIRGEPDSTVAVRVHFIHSRSGRFGADLANCSSCHLAPAHIQRTSQSACLSCHDSYPADHVERFGPIVSPFVGGTIESAFHACTPQCHTTHPRSGF